MSTRADVGDECFPQTLLLANGLLLFPKIEALRSLGRIVECAACQGKEACGQRRKSKFGHYRLPQCQNLPSC